MPNEIYCNVKGTIEIIMVNVSIEIIIIKVKYFNPFDLYCANNLLVSICVC